MNRKKFKHGIYEAKFRPICKKCGLKWPDCKHSEAPERVVVLAAPDQIWAQFNGTNYPAVRYRRFNNFDVVEMVLPENQFRDRYVYVGRFITHVTRSEVAMS